ncbi:MAG: sulfite exporter TauE/SafE family protein [Elusimicrobia bacterium]|nr:sulfite exporter TauE/SafE family protein [Elusimicrobiota bacterium]
MHADLLALTATAGTLGALHTVLGPDHYIPFIAMSKARGWSLRKTATITFLCGLGHISSGVLLGLGGMALGAAAQSLLPIEARRGQIASWLLLIFGFLYTVWGLKKAWSGEPHSHGHGHADGIVHDHEHGHAEAEHEHPHDRAKADITPWILFTVIIFGPCEPLIPVVMYPALAHSWSGVAMVTAAFGVSTIGAMLTLVTAASLGLNALRWKALERYTHALAGGAILLCGIAVVFLGL